jgi:hypothetical protein
MEVIAPGAGGDSYPVNLENTAHTDFDDVIVYKAVRNSSNRIQLSNLLHPNPALESIVDPDAAHHLSPNPYHRQQQLEQEQRRQQAEAREQQLLQQQQEQEEQQQQEQRHQQQRQSGWFDAGLDSIVEGSREFARDSLDNTREGTRHHKSREQKHHSSPLRQGIASEYDEYDDQVMDSLDVASLQQKTQVGMAEVMLIVHASWVLLPVSSFVRSSLCALPPVLSSCACFLCTAFSLCFLCIAFSHCFLCTAFFTLLPVQCFLTLIPVHCFSSHCFLCIAFLHIASYASLPVRCFLCFSSCALLLYISSCVALCANLPVRCFLCSAPCIPSCALPLSKCFLCSISLPLD